MSNVEPGDARMVEVAVVDDTVFDAHRSPSAHPERVERLFAAREALEQVNVPVRSVRARPANAAELERVHHPMYLETLERLRGARGALDADTYLAPGSVHAARCAAGGAADLVRTMLTITPRGAALLRPPGHHALSDRAMGFCLLNNVAIAAAEALARGVPRVAIVDWDVHHGNGTQQIFFDDPRVLFVSLHQWPFYPGTGSLQEIGRGDGIGYTVNIPLSAGCGPAAYRAAFARIVVPILESFAPELLLVSAGFDAHRDDPLAGMRLDAEAYGWMTSQLAAIADKTAHGRLGLFLEGGYDLEALRTSLGMCLRALSSAKPADPVRGEEEFRGEGGGGLAPAVHLEPRLEPMEERDVERARRALASIWRTLA